jgi:hypothetical protein
LRIERISFEDWSRRRSGKVEADDGDNVSQAFFMASVFQFGVQGADVESRFVMEFFCKLR